MFAALGAWISRRPYTVILCWAALALALKGIAPSWDSVTHDGDLAYLPSQVSSVRAERLVSTAFEGRDSRSRLVVVVERADKLLEDADLSAVEDLRAKLEKLLGDNLPVSEIWSPADQVIGYKLVSPQLENVPGQAALIVLHVRNEFMATANIALLEDVQRILDEFQKSADVPAGLKYGVSGSAAIGGDMLGAALESVHKTEIMTFVLIFVILLAVYRAPLLVLIPLGTITVSVSVAMDLVALLTQVQLIQGWEWFNLQVFKTTKIFIITILFGSGTDFCLFLISRYREELETGRDPQAASARSLGFVGEALVGSALTTILGLGTMFFADFGKYRNSGPVIGLCLTVTLLACLTLAPALLRVFGKHVFWPFSASLNKRSTSSPERLSPLNAFWEWMSNWIVRRPGMILVVSILVFSPFAWAGRDVEVTYDLLGELPDNRASVRGTQQIMQYYPPGDTGPIAVLAEQAVPAVVTLDETRQLRRTAKGWTEITLAELASAPEGARDVFLDEPVAKLGVKGNSIFPYAVDMEEQADPAAAATARREERLLRVYGHPGVYASASRPLKQEEVDHLRLDQRATFNEVDGQAMIQLLTKDLYGVYLERDEQLIAQVTSVQSLAEPLGDWPGTPAGPLTPTGRRKMMALSSPRVQSTYVSKVGELAGRVARFDVSLDISPFARNSREYLDLLESKLDELSHDEHSPWFGAKFAYGGTTSATRDLEAVTESDRTLIQRLVVIAVLIAMMLVLRQPWICLYLILTVLYTYFVTIGATELIFGWLWGASFDGLDWKVPLFLFVILVAIGEDYNIYLVSRVFEEQAKHGEMEGLRRATATTGGIISSCGIIMAGTFAAMMIGSLRGMIELGAALSLGVALDTFFVRPVLVPAFLALWYRLRGATNNRFGLETNGEVELTLPAPSAPAPVKSRHARSPEQMPLEQQR